MPHPDAALVRFAENLRDKTKHVFWLGSAISYFSPSSCAGVQDIKRAFVLEPLRRLFLAGRYGQRPGADAARDLLDDMLDRDSVLGRELESLPFEQFMNCLDEASPHTARRVITRACQEVSQRRPGVGPNANHFWFVETALAFLKHGWCQQVTLATTNYDTFLEEALQRRCPAQTLVPVAGDFPIHEVHLHGGLLRIVKPHGCLSRPDQLVYTSRRWTRFLFAPEWTSALERPDAILWAGYSFSDPHLRPLFAEWLSHDPTALVVERRAVRTSGIPTGAEQLRQSFRQAHLDTIAMDCDLGDASTHPLRQLATRLGYALSDQPLTEGHAQPCDGQDLVDMDLPQAVDLLSNLVECCALGGAYDVIAAYLGSASAEDPLIPRLAARALLQLGHVNKYDEAARQCATWRERWPTTQVQLATLGYESFARTIKDPSAESARLAWLALQQGRRLLGTQPGDAESFFRHRDLHFQVKALCYQHQAASPDQLKRSLENPLLSQIVAQDPYARACELAEQLSAGMREETSRQNLYGIAQLEDLRSQMLTLASVLSPDPQQGRAHGQEARRVAERVRDIYFSLGQLNSIILADRTLGWAHLASQPYEPDATKRAIEAFAWGLLRSLSCTDGSLRWKLGANLLRALATAFNAESAHTVANAVPPTLEEACLHLTESKGNADPPLAAALRILLLSDYSVGASRDSLISSLSRYGDTIRYPIFLPPEP
jgi:hypothetical protein